MNNNNYLTKKNIYLKKIKTYFSNNNNLKKTCVLIIFVISVVLILYKLMKSIEDNQLNIKKEEENVKEENDEEDDIEEENDEEDDIEEENVKYMLSGRKSDSIKNCSNIKCKPNKLKDMCVYVDDDFEYGCPLECIENDCPKIFQNNLK